jgi:hypothetical protein
MNTIRQGEHVLEAADFMPRLNVTEHNSSPLEAALVQVGVRNAARARAVIEALGTRYACHPANRVQRAN